jgi:hypothetical protein
LAIISGKTTDFFNNINENTAAFQRAISRYLALSALSCFKTTPKL